MPTAWDLQRSLAKHRAAKRQPPAYIPDPTQEEISPGGLSGLLAPLFDAGLGVLDVIDYLGAATRAGVGKLRGIEGTGRETFLGAAPSGRELAGLGSGTKGKFEWLDIPGFAVEMGLDPMMYLPFGALTKAGKAASRARGLAAKVKVGRANMRGLPGSEALVGTARKLTKDNVKENIRALKKMGYKSLKDVPEYKRLGAQGRSGERSLFSLEVPFTNINQPLSVAGGRISEQALGLLGKAGHGAMRTKIPLSNVRPFEAITKALRPGGRIGIESESEITPSVLEKIALWNEGINAKQSIARGTRNIAAKFVKKETDNLERLKDLGDVEMANPEKLALSVEKLAKHRVAALAMDNMDYMLKSETLERTIGDRIEVLANSQLGDAGQSTLKKGTGNEPWQLTKKQFDEEYVFHATRPGSLGVVREEGIQPGSWFAHSADEPQSFTRASEAQPVFAVRKADLKHIEAAADDIFGQEYMKAGLYKRSGERHFPEFEIHKYDTSDPHRSSVWHALEGGYDVPPAVLEDYPALARWAKTHAPQRALVRPSAAYEAKIEGQIRKLREKLFTEQEVLGFKHAAQQEKILSIAARKLVPYQDAIAKSTEIAERVGDETMQMINRLHAANGEHLAALKGRGVQVDPLNDPLIMYAHRTVNRDVRDLTMEILGTDSEFGKMLKREGSAVENFMKHRAFRGIDTPTVNSAKWRPEMERALDAMDEAAGPVGPAMGAGEFPQRIPGASDKAAALRARYDKVKDAGFFSESPTESILKRYTQGASSEAAAAHWNGTISLFSLPKHLAGHGAQPVEDVIQKGAKNFGVFADRAGMKTDEIAATLKGSALEGQFIPKDIIEAMTRVETVMKDPDELTGLWRFGDKINSIYRFWATQLFPAFQARNETSNIMMSFLAGMRNPAWYFRAMKQQWLANKGDDAAIKLMDRIVAHGSLGRSQLQEVAEMIGSDQASKWLTGGRAGAWAAKKGSLIEDNAKIAMFMWGESTGLTSSEAGDMVKKYLFDYEDLSRFEKQYMRRGAFFYCVPTDCEILTRRGWLRYGEIQEGDDALGYECGSDTAKWTPIGDVAVFDYDGELTTLGNGDSLKPAGYFPFTPEHRWPVWGKEAVGGHYRKIVRGHELNTNHKIPRAAPFSDWPRESLFTPREAAVIGWVITDGTISKQGGWSIYQSPKKFAKEIEDLLGEDACKKAVHPDTGVHMYPIRAALRKQIQAKGFFKRSDAAWVVGTLDKEAAGAMWNAMYKADGTTTDCRLIDGFACMNQDVMNAAQMLVQLLGWRMNHGSKGGFVSKKQRFMKVAGAISSMQYKGKVWCPQTGTGTWLMRRNGKTIFTGNTYTRKSIPLLVEQMAMKPKNLSVYGHLSGEVGSRHEDRDILPPWERARMPFQLWNDAAGNKQFMSTGLPPENLTQFSSEGRGMRRVAQKVAAMAAPTLRMPVEWATGVQLSTGLPAHTPRGVFQKIVEATPEPFKRHIAGLGRLESKLPTARGTSVIKRLMETVEGERSPGEAALSLGAGLTVKHKDPQEQGLRNRMRKINLALDHANLVGESKSQRAKDLRSLRARLSRRLSEMKK